jgi:hypothetical protein
MSIMESDMTAPIESKGGSTLRFKRWCRQCLGQMLVGYSWRSWSKGEAHAVGYRSFGTFHRDEQPEAAVLEECPHCGAELRNHWPLTELELLGRLDQARLSQIESRPLDEATVAAMSAELDLGTEFEEVAVLYGRDPAELRAELEAWVTL